MENAFITFLENLTEDDIKKIWKMDAVLTQTLKTPGDNSLLLQLL
jgi:hypothetical protein